MITRPMHLHFWTLKIACTYWSIATYLKPPEERVAPVPERNSTLALNLLNLIGRIDSLIGNDPVTGMISCWKGRVCYIYLSSLVVSEGIEKASK